MLQLVLLFPGPNDVFWLCFMTWITILLQHETEVIFDSRLNYRLQNLLQVDLQSEFSIDVSEHVVKWIVNLMFECRENLWVGLFLLPACLVIAVPASSPYMHYMFLPAYSLQNMLPNMLHATPSNIRHSLHGLLHSMLHTCFIAHANLLNRKHPSWRNIKLPT